VFILFHRRNIAISNDLNGVRIAIRYWLGWQSFCFVAAWSLVNVRFGYFERLDISNGIVGPKSWDRLHVSEIFAVLGIGLLVWLVAGREVVTIDAALVRIRREIFGVGWSRNYMVKDVRDIRAGFFLDPKANGKWNPDHVRATLYFGYMGKIQSFGNEIVMQDAVRIENAIRQVFPHIVLYRATESEGKEEQH
jgi:hypothetical protein